MVEYHLTLLAIDFLKLMITLYELQDVDYNTFYECCILKIQFLDDVILNIPSAKKREEARLIIDKCKAVINISV